MGRRKTTPHFLQNSGKAAGTPNLADSRRPVQISGRGLLRKPPARLTKGEILRVLGALDREIARRGKTPRKLTLLARATAAGRISTFEAFGSISDMKAPARGVA